MITLKQVTFVLDWTVVIVYEIREVVMRYLFNRSPENIFTLRFGLSGKVKQQEGKGQPRKKEMQLQRNNNELRACHEIHAFQLLPLRDSLLFVNKHMKCGKQSELWPNFLQKVTLFPFEKSFD